MRTNERNLTRIGCAAVLVALACAGCASRSNRQSLPIVTSPNDPAPNSEIPASHQRVALMQHEVPDDEVSGGLPRLVTTALASNPRLSRLEQEMAAAWDRVGSTGVLPDPMVGANGFGQPIETAAGSQRANLSVNQRIPWLARLQAETQQAAYAAMVLEQVWLAERLKIAADVKAEFYRLYLLGQQMRINRANQDALKSLIEVANQRVATGAASQGDVLMGTLELSRLAEELIALEQQLRTAQATLNGLLNRPAEFPVDIPGELAVELPDWSPEGLRQSAVEFQPEIAAAQLQLHGTSWGLSVAELERYPDVTIGFQWFFMDDNRPASRVVDVGRDAWSMGAMVNVPLWHGKYDARECEAARRHYAAQAAVDETVRRYDSQLAALWEQARAADATAKLYRDTILLQARQTLEADQQAYGQGKVEFDRVVRDLRNLITLEAGYHRARAELATAIARIEAAIGTQPAQ